MSEFEEIGHSGDKLEFIVGDEGISIQISHSNPWKFATYQIAATPDGELLDVWPIAGMGRPPRPKPPPVPVWLLSDREGLFGRTCPSCEAYFRTSDAGRLQTCPYCGTQEHNLEFLTENQKQFIKCYLEAFVDAYNARESRTIDLDDLLDGLDTNESGWVYAEEEQQTRHTCPGCDNVYDILGEYGFCPRCGRSNFREVFVGKLTSQKEEFERKDAEVEGRDERESEWLELTRCVSDFEALANEVRGWLHLLPTTPARRRELDELSFQQVLLAAKRLEMWYGLRMLDGFTEDDRQFLLRMVNRRHLLVHRGGRVDQEYVDRTKDTTVRLNQRIRVRSREVRRLLNLIERAGSALVDGVESFE